MAADEGLCGPQLITGSVNNLSLKSGKSRFNWKLTTKYPAIVDAVRDSVGRSPKKFLGRRSQELGLSGALLQRT